MSTEPATSTIPELLRERARRSAHAVACFRRSETGDWVPTAWSELWDRVQIVSAALQEMGLQRGDRLAIFARTCAQWQVVEMAALLCGGVVVGVDPHAAVEHLEYVLRHCGARGLIVEDFGQVGGIAGAVCSRLQFVVALDEQFKLPDHPNWRTWEEIASSGKPAGDIRLPHTDTDDAAVLLYTSGTTGRSKAIEFTHRQVLLACRAISRAYPDIGAADRVLCWLPMAHLFQRMINLVAIARGARTYFVEDPREVMACVREVQPSVFVAVPRFYEKLHEGILEALSSRPRVVRWVVKAALRAGIARAEYTRAVRRPGIGLRIRHHLLDRLVLRRIRAMMGGDIKFMITGSAPTPPWLLEFFHGMGLLILEGYGLSENTIPVAANRPESFRFGSVGKPFCREEENEIRFASDGEIEVRGPGVFRGYYNDEDQDNLFTADGFYRTGDLGYLDEDGFLYLTGRKSEIIKTSTGRRISPARVEAVYCRSPYLDQVVVFGNGRKHLVALVAVNRPAVQREFTDAGIDLGPVGDEFGNSPAVEDLVRREIESCGRDLSPHERIGKFAILAEPLSVSRGELTPTLKVRRDRVRALRADLIEQLYRDPPDPGPDEQNSPAPEKLAR
jgi:long-chain acyl-CoA synthetase